MKDSIYISEDIVTICTHFAERSYKSSADMYASRKQVNESKIKQDIMLGKLAEFGVYFIYLANGRTNITAPDLNIYPAKQKSFDPDLRWGLFNLHIKSQTIESANRYGDSWVFQSNDPAVKSPNEYDIFVGTGITYSDFGNGSHGERLLQYRVDIKLERKLDELKFGTPKLAKFNANNKTCIYLKDNV